MTGNSTGTINNAAAGSGMRAELFECISLLTPRLRSLQLELGHHFYPDVWFHSGIPPRAFHSGELFEESCPFFVQSHRTNLEYLMVSPRHLHLRMFNLDTRWIQPSNIQYLTLRFNRLVFPGFTDWLTGLERLEELEIWMASRAGVSSQTQMSSLPQLSIPLKNLCRLYCEASPEDAEALLLRMNMPNLAVLELVCTQLTRSFLLPIIKRSPLRVLQTTLTDITQSYEWLVQGIRGCSSLQIIFLGIPIPTQESTITFMEQLVNVPHVQAVYITTAHDLPRIWEANIPHIVTSLNNSSHVKTKPHLFLDLKDAHDTKFEIKWFRESKEMISALDYDRSLVHECKLENLLNFNSPSPFPYKKYYGPLPSQS